MTPQDALGFPSVTGDDPQGGSAPTVDLSACDREQVQYPGAIMPHGVLVLLAAADYRLVGVSANVTDWLDGPIESLAGGHLDRLVDAKARLLLEESVSTIADSAPPEYLGRFAILRAHHRCDVFAHRASGVVVLEFEATATEALDCSGVDGLAAVTAGIAAVQTAATWQEGMQIAARELKRLTGFDSVVGTRFLDDGSFQAIAEAREAHFLPLLDKRFPRSDIPEPGRRQMMLMPVQYAPDLGEEPSPLILFDSRADPSGIDLGLAMLRSISRMCNRFYLNMGVRSRMVLSLAQQGELWGFFSCLNVTPRRLSYPLRLACQAFAETAMLLLVEKEKAERRAQALEAKRRIAEIGTEIASASPFGRTVEQLPERLLSLFDVSGAAVCLGGPVSRAGETPPLEMISSVMNWLDGQEALYLTDRLALRYPPAAAHTERAAGLIAARLLEPGQYVLGFRPEWVHEVTWAGNPAKPVEIDIASGEDRFTPRGSFEAWKQQVRGTSRPWQPWERESMADLRRELLDLQQAEKLRAMSLRLEESNAELEDFAFTASHDLREPLRGIRNFAQFLAESAGERLENQERAWLDTIMTLSTRMADQIDALLRYARAGRQMAEIRSTDLNELLQSVSQTLSARIGETGTRLEIPRPLPRVDCDPVLTAAVFENLITNAIKYNQQAQKRVEIGFLEGEPPTFFVRDNGIGIPKEHRETVFVIFRRLHPRDGYGGGIGAGLSITRKHVERHGGRIWLESIPGEGSTFYFTLGPTTARRGVEE